MAKGNDDFDDDA